MRRLLIVGCGDVAMRAAPALRSRYRIFGLARSAERFAELRTRHIVPVCGDLDDPASLAQIGGLAHDVLHLAPPPARGHLDTRTASLLAALAKGGSLPQHFLYISTSGVYGDCAGEVVRETRRLNPVTARARRRADAERQVRAFGRRTGVRVTILRVPGIYAADRLPIARLKAGTPALAPEDDAYTNHVHADDLAGIIVAALRSGRPCRVYNASDDSGLKMGEYFDRVADRFGLPRPPRIPRAEAAARIPEPLLSFMGESRRLANDRIKRELGVRLRYPTVDSAIARLGPVD